MDHSRKSENLVFSLMNKKGYIAVSKKLVVFLEDFSTAGLFCELVSKMEDYRDKNQLIEDKWFYYTRESIQKDFLFSEYEQRKMFKLLEEKGLVESIIFPNSIPQKKYYTVNFDKLVEILSKDNNV